jgi:hypothetical protein
MRVLAVLIDSPMVRGADMHFWFEKSAVAESVFLGTTQQLALLL